MQADERHPPRNGRRFPKVDLTERAVDIDFARLVCPTAMRSPAKRGYVMIVSCRDDAPPGIGSVKMRCTLASDQAGYRSPPLSGRRRWGGGATGAPGADRDDDSRTFGRSARARLLDRIAAREKLVHAWAHLDAEGALTEARRLDALPPAERGPLHGMPIGIKDVFLTRDMPTRYGSTLYPDFAPAIDAAAVATLRAAGAVLLGKKHTVEFASIGAKPPTCNPANLAHTPGGSSSGSAAAVADGHVPLRSARKRADRSSGRDPSAGHGR